MLQSIQPQAHYSTPPLPAQSTHCFFNNDEVDSYPKLLAKPYQHFIEMHEYVHLGNALAFIRDEYPDISLSLTTKTAFRQPIADFFAQHLANQRDFSEGVIMRIKTCLQEAVMNSIIHGNLAIEHDGDAKDNFQHYLEKISRHIDDESLSLKRICIFAWLTERHITLCVSDQGKGFGLNQPAVNIAEPYGRGLFLIRNMCGRLWQTQPNHLYMQFTRHD
jgi:anti-sigma regulatory factor (Ser/Thr protein kinase)